MVGKKTLAIAGMFILGVASSSVANALGVINLLGIVNAVISAVYFAMMIKIPLWSILLMAFLLFAAVSLYLFFVVFRKRSPEPPALPEWLDFTSIKHEGRLFEWDYNDDAEPVNFRELCAECECELNGNKCPQCGWSRPFAFNGILLPITHPIPREVEKVVNWHIKNGTYKEFAAFKKSP